MIANVLSECVPQLIVIVVALSGAFGGGLVKSSASKVADFMAQGGAPREPVRFAAEALTTGILAIGSFGISFVTVFLDALFALMTGEPFAALLYAVLGVAVAEMVWFMQIVMTQAPHDLAINRSTKFLRFSGSPVIDLSPARMIERASLSLMVLSFVVAVIKIWPPPANPARPAPAISAPASGDQVPIKSG